MSFNESSPYYKNRNSINIVDTLNKCLDNISKNSHLNAFVNIYKEEALNKAESLKSSISNQGSQQSDLTGMIVSIKDLFCYKDHPVSAGSKILENFVSQITATCVDLLLNQGAIIIGHNNCDEFGMGSSNENSAYGPVLNPYDNKLVSGGSSGGSAVAVKTGMCHISLGTDTGGSVRQPASFCGVVGFKPTYSRISRYGVIAYASSFDTVGILAQDIEDCAVALNSMAKNDLKDNTCSNRVASNYIEDLNKVNHKKDYKIAYFKDMLDNDNIDSEVREATMKSISSLKSKGYKVEDISFPLLDYVLPVYYILSTAEASANLARYDGIRYGFRDNTSSDIDTLYKRTRTKGFGFEVKRRILLGTSILSEGYHNAYYDKAQRARRKIVNYFQEIFKTYDFILSPTTPTTAVSLNANKDPISMYLSDLFTVPASIAGIPAISIPVSSDSKGLPIGLQLMANYFQESALLGFAKLVMG